MLVNSSSSNDSLVRPQPSFIFPIAMECLITPPISFVFTTFNIINVILFLPLGIFILHHGLQQWRQRKRSTSSAVTVSHSDIFTYHMVVMELIRIIGNLLCIVNLDLNMLSVASLFLFFTWYGETFFHVLTCVERHLAVVHPITYLSLRNQRGIRIRNISIGWAWLLSFAGTCSMLMESFVKVVNFCLSISSLTITFFCSLSVLRVLIRPGPGEQGGGRERVDQSKQRAFYTILFILGALVIRCVFSLVWLLMYVTVRGNCVILLWAHWFNLPSSLMLPLLFLHRKGKLVCCNKNVR